MFYELNLANGFIIRLLMSVVYVDENFYLKRNGSQICLKLRHLILVKSRSRYVIIFKYQRE